MRIELLKRRRRRADGGGAAQKRATHTSINNRPRTRNKVSSIRYRRGCPEISKDKRRTRFQCVNGGFRRGGTIGSPDRACQLCFWGRGGRMVLPERIELSTSPLPMGCSTTELRQQSRKIRPKDVWGGRARRKLPQGVRRRKNAGFLYIYCGRRAFEPPAPASRPRVDSTLFDCCFDLWGTVPWRCLVRSIAVSRCGPAC